jgi:hypothetical protein
MAFHLKFFLLILIKRMRVFQTFSLFGNFDELCVASLHQIAQSEQLPLRAVVDNVGRLTKEQLEAKIRGKKKKQPAVAASKGGKILSEVTVVPFPVGNIVKTKKKIPTKKEEEEKGSGSGSKEEATKDEKVPKKGGKKGKKKAAGGTKGKN